MTASTASDSRLAVRPEHKLTRLLNPSPRLCWAALTIAWVTATALLLWLHRDLTFAVDEFDFSETAGTGSIEDLLAPKNGHLIVLPLLLYKLLYTLFGTTLAPFTLVEGLMLAAVSAGLYVFSRPRVGPLLALVPAVLPLFLGSAWPLLMPPMIGLLWICSIAGGLWALVLVKRDARAGDIAACGLLCLSLASFTFGMVFIAACALAILLAPGRWRRVWIVAIPIAAWIGWRLWAMKYGSIEAHYGYLLLLPAYAVDSIAANAAALFGRTLPYSPATSLYLDGFSAQRLVATIGLVAVEVLACLAVIRRVGVKRLNRPSVWIVLVIPLVWWASQVVVLEEFRTPETNRYFFAGVVILLMVVVEIARGLRVTPTVVGIAFALAAVALVGNLAAFRHGRAALVTLSDEAKANMAAIELAGRRGDQAFVLSSEQLTPQSQFMFLTVGRYLDVVERYGSPADSLGELARRPEPIRQAADITLARLLLLHSSPVHGQVTGRCRRYTGLGDRREVVVRLPLGGAILRSKAPRPLRLGRFADGYPVRIGRLKSSTPVRIEIPPDGSRRMWRLSAAGTAPLSVCPSRNSTA